MPKSPSTAPSAPPAPSFEAALARLETLVEEMDARNLPLQELLAHYEEGVGLVKVCEDRLVEAERRIEIITRDATGKPALEPFEPESKVEPAAPGEVSLF